MHNREFSFSKQLKNLDQTKNAPNSINPNIQQVITKSTVKVQKQHQPQLLVENNQLQNGEKQLVQIPNDFEQVQKENLKLKFQNLDLLNNIQKLNEKVVILSKIREESYKEIKRLENLTVKLQIENDEQQKLINQNYKKHELDYIKSLKQEIQIFQIKYQKISKENEEYIEQLLQLEDKNHKLEEQNYQQQQELSMVQFQANEDIKKISKQLKILEEQQQFSIVGNLNSNHEELSQLSQDTPKFKENKKFEFNNQQQIDEKNVKSEIKNLENNHGSEKNPEVQNTYLTKKCQQLFNEINQYKLKNENLNKQCNLLAETMVKNENIYSELKTQFRKERLKSQSLENELKLQHEEFLQLGQAFSKEENKYKDNEQKLLQQIKEQQKIHKELQNQLDEIKVQEQSLLKNFQEFKNQLDQEKERTQKLEENIASNKEQQDLKEDQYKQQLNEYEQKNQVLETYKNQFEQVSNENNELKQQLDNFKEAEEKNEQKYSLLQDLNNKQTDEINSYKETYDQLQVEYKQRENQYKQRQNDQDIELQSMKKELSNYKELCQQLNIEYNNQEEEDDNEQEYQNFQQQQQEEIDNENYEILKLQERLDSLEKKYNQQELEFTQKENYYKQVQQDLEEELNLSRKMTKQLNLQCNELQEKILNQTESNENLSNSNELQEIKEEQKKYKELDNQSELMGDYKKLYEEIQIKYNEEIKMQEFNENKYTELVEEFQQIGNEYQQLKDQATKLSLELNKYKDLSDQFKLKYNEQLKKESENLNYSDDLSNEIYQLKEENKKAKLIIYKLNRYEVLCKKLQEKFDEQAEKLVKFRNKYYQLVEEFKQMKEQYNKAKLIILEREFNKDKFEVQNQSYKNYNSHRPRENEEQLLQYYKQKRKQLYQQCNEKLESINDPISFSETQESNQIQDIENFKQSKEFYKRKKFDDKFTPKQLKKSYSSL